MTLRKGCFDLETDGLLPTATQVWCGVVKDMDSGTVQSFGSDDIAGLLGTLATFDVLVGHNVVGFDFPILESLYGWTYKGRVADTLLMSRTQRSKRRAPAGSKSGPHSVESWGIRLGLDKVENDVWDTYSPIILERCKQDVEIQVKIFAALMEEGDGEGWAKAHRLNTKLFGYLGQQERSGWHVDQPLLAKNMHQLQRWIDMIANAINPSLPLVTEVLETKKAGQYAFISKPFKKSGEKSAIVCRYLDDCRFFT